MWLDHLVDELSTVCSACSLDITLGHVLQSALESLKVNDWVEDDFSGCINQPKLRQLVFAAFDPDCEVWVRVFVRAHSAVQETGLVVFRTRQRASAERPQGVSSTNEG